MLQYLTWIAIFIHLPVHIDPAQVFLVDLFRSFQEKNKFAVEHQ